MGCKASNLSRSVYVNDSCDWRSVDDSVEVLLKRAQKYAAKHGKRSGYRPRESYPMLINVIVEKQESCSRPSQRHIELHNVKTKVSKKFEIYSMPPLSNIECSSILGENDIKNLDEPEYFNQISIIKDSLHGSALTKDTEMDDDDDDDSYLNNEYLDDKDPYNQVEASINDKILPQLLLSPMTVVGRAA